MNTPQICAGLRRGLWAPILVISVLSLTACATRVEWTPQPDPTLGFDLEPGFASWADNVSSVGEAVLSAPLPLPERLRLPDGRRLLPTWTGLSIDSLSLPKRSTRSRQQPPLGTGFRQVGVASWYGPDFHGGPTANGETYDQNSMTAAHPTLPFNSVVQVKDLTTGHSVNVRINNRGPFVGGRIIDLSVGAAKALGTYERGVARVEIKRIQ